MAASGSFLSSGWYSSSKGDYVYLEFAWEVTTTSIEKNQKTIYWQLRGKRTASGFINAGGFKVVIDGDTVYSKSTDYRIELRNGTVVASGSKTLTHKNDGTRSFSVSIQGGLYTFAVNCTGSATFTLDTIPRVSSISCTSAHIGSKPVITISRHSPSFTHTVKYHPPNYKQGDPLVTIVEKTSATTISNWTIPESFYDIIPSYTEAVTFLECTTYNGNTAIGTSTCPLYMTTDETKCKPKVSGSVVIIDDTTRELTGREDTIIRYGSMVTTQITAEPKNGAKISLTTINNNVGETWGTGQVETNVFDFYAKDSRGYFNSDKIVLNMVPYIKLTNDSTAQRTDSTSGKVDLKIEGNWFNGNFGAAENELTIHVDIEEAEKYLKVTPNIDGNKYSANLSITGADYTKSYTIVVTVFDKVGMAKKTITIPKGIPVFDWGEEDFNFNVPVKIDGSLTIGQKTITEAQLASLLALIK